MSGRLPLSALLSQALVAFTIEFDNEFEHRTPHRTTDYGSTGGPGVPWLVSLAVWVRYLRFVPHDGITVREFERAAALSKREMKIWLTRLSQWWSYVVIHTRGDADPLDWVIRPTLGGQKALEVWRPLTGIIEERWRERFGKDAVEGLFQAMQGLAARFGPELPDYLPILGFDLSSSGFAPERCGGAKGRAASEERFTLPILLAKVLLAFAIAYERRSGLSLAVSANVLRIVSEEGTRIRDLPRLSGVSKQAIAMAVKRLEAGGLAVAEAESKGSRLKALRLTARGQEARDSYYRLVGEIENDWMASYGVVVSDLRRSLQHLVEEGPDGRPPLFRGLEPYPDGWRASAARRDVLPHYPMILHRGGFPDGS